MHNDWPSFQHRLTELLAAFEAADTIAEPDVSPRWLHVRLPDGSIASYAPQESALETVRRAQRRTAWTNRAMEVDR